MSDTDPVIEARQVGIWRRMTPEQRLEAALEASELARDLALARIRAEHPDWDEPRLRRELLRLALLPDPLPMGLQ